MCALTWAVYSNFRIIYDCCCRCPFNINRPWGPSNQEIFYWSLSSVIIHLCIHNWEMLCVLSCTVANYLCKRFCSWSMFGSEMVRSLRRLKRWQRIDLVSSERERRRVWEITQGGSVQRAEIPRQVLIMKVGLNYKVQNRSGGSLASQTR